MGERKFVINERYPLGVNSIMGYDAIEYVFTNAPAEKAKDFTTEQVDVGGRKYTVSKCIQLPAELVNGNPDEKGTLIDLHETTRMIPLKKIAL